MSRTMEKAYDYIYAAIASGRLAPGEHVPEEKVAAELNISRTPVREAIRRLESEGLVVITRNSGADVLRLDDEEIVETFKLRAMLEGYAAHRAASRVSAQDLAMLGSLAGRIAALDQTDVDLLDATRLNAEFHLQIARSARSPRLYSLIRGLVHVPMTLMHRGDWGMRLAGARGFDEHSQIVEALRHGDGDLAQSLMQAHILGASSRAAASAGKVHAMEPARRSAAKR
jgi:DNA-binding GntR family transcriptional regulator